MSPRRRLSDVRRHQILEAAVFVIAERGLCDTRISDVAARVGTSSALILYYFESKDRLLADALSFADERFYHQTQQELSLIPRARDKLIRLIELSCPNGPAGSDPSPDEWVLWFELWTRAPRDPDVARGRQELDDKWRNAIADIVVEGQRRKEFGRVDPRDFAIRLAALMDGLAVQVVLRDPTVDRDRMREMCLRTAAAELGFQLPRNRRRPAAKVQPTAARVRAGMRPSKHEPAEGTG
jgi:AcrR family transcriptional regulator